MAITEPKIEKYLYNILPERDAFLAERETCAREHDIPRIGPALELMIHPLARISGARRIFEMGSAIGYSAIWLARAAMPAGEVYYTDGDSANAERARNYLSRAKGGEHVRILVGDAVELIDGVAGEFDLIFIAVQKQQYPAALRKALPRLKSGACFSPTTYGWANGWGTREGRENAGRSGIQ